MRDPDTRWGPWAHGITHSERLARVRSLRTLVHARWGIEHPLVVALFIAESLDDADLATALAALDAVPTRDQRNLVSLYQAVNTMKIVDKARRSAERRAS